MEEKMKSMMQKGYRTPIVDIYLLDQAKDVLCMSTERNDNDFGAGDMSDFLD